MRDILEAYSIFGSEKEAIKISVERFEDETKEAFLDFYKKLVPEDIDFDSEDEEDNPTPVRHPMQNPATEHAGPKTPRKIEGYEINKVWVDEAATLPQLAAAQGIADRQAQAMMEAREIEAKIEIEKQLAKKAQDDYDNVPF